MQNKTRKRGRERNRKMKRTLGRNNSVVKVNLKPHGSSWEAPEIRVSNGLYKRSQSYIFYNDEAMKISQKKHICGYRQ